jgi:hypothetical protein
MCGGRTIVKEEDGWHGRLIWQDWKTIEECYAHGQSLGKESRRWVVELQSPSAFNIQPTIPIGEDFAKLLGYLFSDGTFAREQSPKFTNVRSVLLEDVAYLTASCFGTAITPSKRLKRPKDLNDKGTDSMLTNTDSYHGPNPLKERMRLLDLESKESFGVLQTLRPRELVAFIQGFFNGDGCLNVHQTKSSKSPEIRFYTGLSERQSYELQFMLWRLGIRSYPGWTSGCWEVRVMDIESVSRLLDLLDDRKYPDKFALAKQAVKKASREKRLKDGNSLWLPITKIEKLGIQTVVGWEAEPNHEVILQGGIRSHNSGKTVEMMGAILTFAEETSKAVVALMQQVEAGTITQEYMNERVKHLRICYANFPTKVGLLRADCEAEAKRLDGLGDKWGAWATRHIADYIFYIGDINNVPKLPEYAGVQVAAPSVYHFIAWRRTEVDKSPLPDEDEGRDYFGIDEAQDLIPSRRSGDRYVKILSGNADFFRKMGLEVQYQGPQQSQMDKNFKGKHQVAGDKVLMADGSLKNVEEVKVADRVISPNLDGTPSRIANVIGTHHYLPDYIYEVRDKVTKKRLYSCSPEHILPMTYVRVRRLHRHPRQVEAKRVIEDMSAEKAAKLCGWKVTNHVHTFSSPLIEFDRSDSVVAPYPLGVWLGDGSCASKLPLRSIVITSQNREIITPFYESYPGECGAGADRKGTPAKSYYISSRGQFAADLTRLGLAGKNSGTKFIPEECKHSSSVYRIELLSGLFDTDGYIEESGRMSYTTKSKQLAEDVSDLVHSLGGRANIRTMTKTIKDRGFIGTYFNVSVAFSKNPLKLRTWKKDRLRDAGWGSNYVSVELVRGKPQEVYGIEIDSPSKYYITNEWLVTHNSSKKVLAEKFEYKDPKTGLTEDPETKTPFYFTKYTVFDYSQTEKRKSANFFMPFEDKENMVAISGDKLVGQGAKLVHRYYGTNVFPRQSLTTRNTMQEFLQENPESATQVTLEQGETPPLPGGGEPGTRQDLVVALAQEFTTVYKVLTKNPFYNMDPKDAKNFLKSIVELGNNPLVTMAPKDAKKLLKKLEGLSEPEKKGKKKAE